MWILYSFFLCDVFLYSFWEIISIFLNSPSTCITQVISCFSFLHFMSPPFQCKCIRHAFESQTASPQFQQQRWQTVSWCPGSHSPQYLASLLLCLRKKPCSVQGNPQVSGVNPQKATLGVSGQKSQLSVLRKDMSEAHSMEVLRLSITKGLWWLNSKPVSPYPSSPPSSLLLAGIDAPIRFGHCFMGNTHQDIYVKLFFPGLLHLLLFL